MGFEGDSREGIKYMETSFGFHDKIKNGGLDRSKKKKKAIWERRFIRETMGRLGREVVMDRVDFLIK